MLDNYKNYLVRQNFVLAVVKLLKCLEYVMYTDGVCGACMYQWGVTLWLMTFVGAWFNGLTLAMLCEYDPSLS